VAIFGFDGPTHPFGLAADSQRRGGDAKDGASSIPPLGSIDAKDGASSIIACLFRKIMLFFDFVFILV
jgi:hypothetical protein